MMVLLAMAVGVSMGVSVGPSDDPGASAGVDAGPSHDISVSFGGGSGVDQVGTVDSDRGWGSFDVHGGFRSEFGHGGGGGNHEPRVLTGHESKR